MSRIYTRGQWGARYARGFRAASLPVGEIWLHHSVTSSPAPSATLSQDAAAVRTLENIGQNRFRGGISYTFVVARSGRIFDGHGVNRQGAHTGGRNHISRAICLIGNYENLGTTAAQRSAVAWLLRHGRSRGWFRRARLNGGHRNAPGAATACPGRHGQSQIAAINRAAASGGSTPAPSPSPTPSPPRRDDPLMAISGSENQVLNKIADRVFSRTFTRTNPTTETTYAVMIRHLYQVLLNGNGAMVRYPHNDGEGSVRYAAEQGWRRSWEANNELTEQRDFDYWDADGERHTSEGDLGDLVAWTQTAVNQIRQEQHAQSLDALDKITEQLTKIDSRLSALEQKEK